MNKRVSTLRKALKMNKSEFARQLGMSEAAVRSWENNKNNLKESSILLIIRTFNVNPEWLRAGKGEVFLPKAEADITPDLEDIFAWQKSLSRDEQVWLKVEMQKCFPKFKEWLGN